MGKVESSDNLEQMAADLKLQEETVNEIREEMHIGAEEIKDAAIPLTPFRDGHLRGSATVRHRKNSAAISFGSSRAFYARQVHEINRNYRVGGWKYLDRAMEEILPRIQKSIDALFR